MAVETAADIASMFDPDEFAEGAGYLASGGVAVPCFVVVDRGQGRQAFRAGEAGEAVGAERMLSVPLTADGLGGLAGVARDAIFTMLDEDGLPTGEAFRVAGLPRLDQTARLWSVELVIAS